MRHALVRIAASMLLLIAGCRSELFVPAPVEGPDAPVGPYQLAPWPVDVRVIGEDGQPVDAFRASISNADYYDREDPLREQVDFRDRPDVGPTLTESGIADGRIVPPFDVRLVIDSDGGSEEWPLLARTLVPGETLVIDRRQTTHLVELDFDTPPIWGAPDVRFLAREDSLDGSVGNGSFGSLKRLLQLSYDARPSSFGIVVDPAIERLIEASVRWDWEDGGDLRSLEWERFELGLDPADAAVIALEDTWTTRRVRVQRRGRRLTPGPVSIRVESTPGVQVAFSFTTTTDGARPVIEFPSFGTAARVEISGVSNASWFFPRTIDFDAVADTVDVEIGPLDLDVEVVDRRGVAVPAARVRIQVANDPTAGTLTMTVGGNGRTQFALQPALYRIEGDIGGSTSTITADTLMNIDADTELRLELPR